MTVLHHLLSHSLTYRHFSWLRYGLFILSVLALSGCELVTWKANHDRDQLIAAGYEEHYLPLEDGGKMRYWVGGTGKPLLLLHGFGGSAISTWKSEMLDLNKDYKVIAPDLAWFGDSYSQGNANLTTQTNAVWHLMDTLGIEKFNVAGISYGGFVTYDLMTQPERIEKSIIIASPGPLFSDDDLSALCQRAGVDKPEHLFVPENGQEVRRLFNHVFFTPKRMPDFVADQIYDSYFSSYKKQKTALIQSLVDDRSRISTYPTRELPPTMLIWGDNDQIFPLESGIALSKHLQAPMVVIPNTGHGVTNEQPDLVTQLVKSYLQ
ncbi:alpha/beta fold hydrolase [Photobacterium aphoticum]|uniref:alpha/beta fold hydrolase n=1 Tax=Photobacterium aphoticum TaxID=754436 RepID=UPI0009E61C0D|nr:alpha/beta hydrolase [Photobacterium aphoticum]PSU60174.1 alpha/beta hydrolase [Photobacterium aphoticum]GHA33767.1 alpha/beta hydrolase [Photobacterium aphoticum]